MCSSRINTDQFLVSDPVFPLRLGHNGCSSAPDQRTLYLGSSDIFIKHLSMLQGEIYERTIYGSFFFFNLFLHTNTSMDQQLQKPLAIYIYISILLQTPSE